MSAMMILSFRAELLLLSLTIFHNSNCYIITRNSLCNLQEDQTKQFYKKLFKNSTEILITTISLEGENKIDYFTNFFLKDVISIPVTIVEVNFEQFQLIDLKHNNLFKQTHWNYILIFIEEVIIFQKFLEMDILAPILSYVVIYAKNDDCQNLIGGMTEILTKLWKTHKILNVFSQAPCACDENIYSYQPFKKDENKKFGVIKIDKIKMMSNKESVPVERCNKLKNMNRWPVKVSIFRRELSMMINITKDIKINDTCYKCGVDAQILGTIARYMNFKIVVDQDPRVGFGSVYRNGSITGAMGKVVRAEVDFAGNARFIDQPNMVKYTNPIYNEEMCIVLPKAPKKPQWMTVLDCFSWTVWLCIVFIELLFFGFTHFVMKSRLTWIQLFAISNSIPTNLQYFRFKYLLAVYIIYSMIMGNIFQGNLVRSFGTVQESYDMRTLKEFSKSPYKIHTSYVNIFRNLDSDIYNQLRQKIVDTSTSRGWTLEKVAKQRAFAGLERRSDAKYIIETKFLDRTGYPKLHVIDECPRIFFLGYAMQLKTPYVNEFNKILERLKEGGFIHKWRLATTKFQEKEKNTYTPLTYSDMQVAIYILGAGHIMGFIAFIGELLWYRTRKHY